MLSIWVWNSRCSLICFHDRRFILNNFFQSAIYYNSPKPFIMSTFLTSSSIMVGSAPRMITRFLSFTLAWSASDGYRGISDVQRLTQHMRSKPIYSTRTRHDHKYTLTHAMDAQREKCLPTQETLDHVKHLYTDVIDRMHITSQDHRNRSAPSALVTPEIRLNLKDSVNVLREVRGTACAGCPVDGDVNAYGPCTMQSKVTPDLAGQRTIYHAQPCNAYFFKYID